MVFRIRYILDQKVLEVWSMIKRRSTCTTKWNINSLWKFCSRKNHIFLIFNGIKHLFFVNQILCSSPVDMSWKHFVPLGFLSFSYGVPSVGSTALLRGIPSAHILKAQTADCRAFSFLSGSLARCVKRRDNKSKKTAISWPSGRARRGAARPHIPLFLLPSSPPSQWPRCNGRGPFRRKWTRRGRG